MAKLRRSVRFFHYCVQYHYRAHQSNARLRATQRSSRRDCRTGAVPPEWLVFSAHWQRSPKVTTPNKKAASTSQINDATGTRQNIAYSNAGQIASLTNALGTSTQFGYDANGLLSTRTLAANTPDAASLKLGRDSHGQPTIITDPNGVATQRRYDDFGHKMVQTNPDRGISLYRYDAAGRLIARIDESHSATLYTYDNANRLAALGSGDQPDQVQYRYQGRDLTDVISSPDGKTEHATSRTSYQRDAFGQIRQESKWIARVDATKQSAGLTFITRSSYDAAGRLLQQTLPDGHQITYRYTPADQTGSQAPGQRPGQLNAILFDNKLLISDIAQSITGGMTGYRNGNGLRQEIKFDASGRIVQLQTSAQASTTQQDWWQQVKAWFGKQPANDNQIVYKQGNHYDAAGRLTHISRQQLDPSSGQLQPGTAQDYGYDRQDRLTTVQGNEGNGANSTSTRYRYCYRYDAGGNRTAESVELNKGQRQTVSTANDNGGDADHSIEKHYRYAAGSNRLISITRDGATASPTHQPASGMQKVGYQIKQTSNQAQNQNLANGAELVQTAWLYHATGVPLAQLQLNHAAIKAMDNASSEQGNRRIVYNSAKRPIAVYNGNDQIIARYHYNQLGERIAKTVYPVSDSKAAKGGMTAVNNPANTKDTADKKASTASTAHTKQEQQGSTRYSLYSQQRLSAETDSEGQITAHYVYLYGKPVAKIEMRANTSATHKAWKAITSLGGLLLSKEIDASDTQASIYAIHTDQLGTPQAVTDQQAHIVWQADTTPFGMAKVSYAAMMKTGGSKTNAKTNTKAKAFEMNLRLPGQVHDAETGLNQNYYRDYDPIQGRYTTPDPMGIEGGMNPYTYVSNNPLMNIDPLGLYESDIHYYMTFFLAVAAGVDYGEARTMALATQYVDNNPLTEPIDVDQYGNEQLIKSVFDNQQRLKDYHFTLSDGDTGKTAAQYKNNIITGPSSPQLDNLLGASQKAPTRCGQLQFFGEYLHAFEDTFSHRDPNNIPFDAVWTAPILGTQFGIGHGLYDSNPDYTWNVQNGCGIAGCYNWDNNASRTLEMEAEVFYKLKTQFKGSGKAMDWPDVKKVVEQFNVIEESEGDKKGFKDKFKKLNETLAAWGYKATNADGSERAIDLFTDDQYTKEKGAEYRDKNLCDKDGKRLKQWDYLGTILPGTECPP